MSKILVGIPVLYGPQHCFEAIDSVYSEADVLIIDNGADADVKQVLEVFHCNRIVNKHNIYVNPAWNQILEYFLNSDYDQLVIMNSDLIVEPGWSNNLVDGMSCVPTDGSHATDVEVFEGTPGVFIHLNKEMARLVYPIPEGIKIWFGDTFLYHKLRKSGYKTIVKSNIIAHHYQNGSQTVKVLPGISELIELDKLAWAEIEKTL